mmetsp:Transcript_21327/g.47160  ORF Transcript_21327/g.47160 Transcript_21327/m.47160 type:complete len:427 (-) Transcript_21327:366-1646(-)
MVPRGSSDSIPHIVQLVLDAEMVHLGAVSNRNFLSIRRLCPVGGLASRHGSSVSVSTSFTDKLNEQMQRAKPKLKAQDVDPALIDSFGRRHTYLRVSLTDRCNLRCQYCVPEEGDDQAALSPNALTAAELKRIIGLFVKLGIRKIRLTGGEPTIRRDFAEIVGDIGEVNRSLPEPMSLGITTNGVRLQRFIPQLQEAGLNSINLSLDTLIPEKFPMIARRPIAWHTRVMGVLEELRVHEEDFTVKVNCVLLRGVNEDEIGAFVDLTEHHKIEIRFLEFMPFDQNGWSAGRLVPQAKIVADMQEHLRQRGVASAERQPPDSPHDVARIWRVPGWRGRLGVIASMTDAFCGGCNRIRLTSDGQLRNCLFGEEGWSIRDSLRAGASDHELTQTIAQGISSKHAKLGGKKDMHELKERGGLNLSMMALGG